MPTWRVSSKLLQPAPHLWARIPLFGKLLVLTGLTLLMAGVLMLYSTVRQEAVDARSDMDAELRDQLRTLPTALAESIVVGDYATLRQSIDYEVAQRSIDQIRFTDATGATVQRSDGTKAQRAPAWFVHWSGLRDLDGDTEVIIGGHRYGTIHVILSARIAVARLWKRFLLELGALSLALGLDFAGIWLTLRGALRPLGALNNAAAAIARGDLSARVRSSGGPELTTFLETFNRMAGAVEEARYKLCLEKERVQVTLASIGDAVITTDNAGRVEYLNEVAEHLTGWQTDEAQGRLLPEVFDIVEETSRAPIENPVEQVFREGRVVELANHALLVARDGTERPIADSAAPIRTDREGEILGAVLVFRDQSDERARYNRLQLSESVFQHAQEGIMITDAKAMIVSVNPAFTELTGYSPAEVIGRSPSLLSSGMHNREFYANMWSSLINTGHWRGELWNRRKTGELFVEQMAITAVPTDDGESTHYIGVFSDISELKSQQQHLERIAHYDALTQLPNRVLLADRLQVALGKARRQGNMLAVCYLDLDGFKPVNDKFGHETGDRLLIEISGRLTMALRVGDTVARLGGDEFVILLEGLDDLDECRSMLDRILKVVAKPCTSVNSEITDVSASVGVTLFPHDDTDPETLLRHADQAMYVAKQNGRNRYHLFDPDYDRRVRAHREAVKSIQEALENGEFVLNYQPKVDMRLGQVVGVEALIAWDRPQHGLSPPSEFLPYIENSALSSRLDEWVLERALAQMDEWRLGGLRLPVSVNISAQHLQQADMIARLSQALSRYPEMSAGDLELEIVETSALDDILHVNRLIEGCQRLGVSFALDDFGTGYSSLSYLKRLPAETLKIDQSFVRDMLRDAEDLAIVEGVIGLADAFNREVIAEGVETVSHGVLLLHLGCDMAQGFGIARPMQGSKIPEWVASWAPDPRWTEALTDTRYQENPPMLIVELEHWAWCESIIAWVGNAAAGNWPRPVLDESSCAFLRWMRGPGVKQYGDEPAFGAVRELRRRLQRLALAMVEHQDAGDRGKAHELLGEFQVVNREMIQTLRQLS